MGWEGLEEFVICVCVWLDAGEWMNGLGLGFTNPVGSGGGLDVCLCFVAVVDGYGAWTCAWRGGVVFCRFEL